MSSTDNKTYKGRLKRWNDSKGFGFIGSEDEDRDIFIHISELKQMTRRPTIGDTITYQIQVQDDGKNRAYNAHIEGVEAFKSKGQNKNPLFSLKNKWLVASLIIAIIVVAYFVAT